MTQCTHCNKDANGETVEIKSKWVSHGPCRNYREPIVLPCHKACKGAFLDDRAKHFAVLDETMNTCRFFERVKGQAGVYRNGGVEVECQGWQTAGELGVDYAPSERYADYY